MPTDIRDPSPTEARRLHIVRAVAFGIAVLLLPTAIAAGAAVCAYPNTPNTSTSIPNSAARIGTAITDPAFA